MGSIHYSGVWMLYFGTRKLTSWWHQGAGRQKCQHLAGFSSSLFILSRPPAHGVVPPTSRVDLPPQLVLTNITLRDTKRCSSIFSILNPVKLTMETDYHRDEGRFQVHHFQHQCPMNGGHMCVVAKVVNVAIVHMSSYFLWWYSMILGVTIILKTLSWSYSCLDQLSPFSVFALLSTT